MSKAIIYLTGVSRSVGKAGKFVRVEALDNLLCYEGRVLETKEFNELVEKALDRVNVPNGVSILVKLIDDPEPENESQTGGAGNEGGDKAPPSGAQTGPALTIIVLPEDVEIEQVDHGRGFVVADYRDEEAKFLGADEATGWQSDCGLVTVFETNELALAAAAAALGIKPTPASASAEAPPLAPAAGDGDDKK